MTINWMKDIFWAIDPGESKCGVAVFRDGRCATALKSTPDECLDRLWIWLSKTGDAARPKAVVVEAFHLRGDLAAMQTGSEMGTSQMIGAIRWMTRHHSLPIHMQTPSQAHALERQEPFASWPQRGWTSYGQGRDAKMAELHGMFRISTSLSTSARRDWHASLS